MDLMMKIAGADPEILKVGGTLQIYLSKGVAPFRFCCLQIIFF